MGYAPCRGDNDLWMKPEIDPDGDKYYSYILCYVDDVLVVHHDAMTTLMMPKTVKESAELDAKNGDTKWMNAILKEMTNVRVAFDIMKDIDRVPIGHK